MPTCKHEQSVKVDMTTATWKKKCCRYKEKK